MREAALLSGASYKEVTKVPGARSRVRLVIACVAVWTAFVVLAVWWLLRTHNGPSVFVVHEG